MTGLAILGSTGMIGSQTLEVAANFPNDFKVVGLVCRRKAKKLAKQVNKFKPLLAAVAERDGEDQVIKAVTHPEVDLVVIATVGLSGLVPTLAAIEAGKDIALATKEVLVLAGELVMKLVKKHRVNLRPIDSELSAIWQCLRGSQHKEVKRVILTLGKGKIAQLSAGELDKVTPEDVLDRQAWQLGRKISVDSATGMNKAFEVIEARWLFDLEPERIELAVHPEYLCHSLVEFIDGSILTELGTADMRRYIHQALFYPHRQINRLNKSLNLVGKKLSFEPAPNKKFPCLTLGHKALEKDGTLAAAMHGADEAAAAAFWRGKIKFTQIFQTVNQVMQQHQIRKRADLATMIKAHEEGKQLAQEFIKRSN